MTPLPATPARTNFLRALFRLLDEQEIRYCVLHSYKRLPEELPSDLDLALHPGDARRLAAVLEALRCSRYDLLQCVNYAINAYYLILASPEADSSSVVAVDIITEHCRSGLILAAGEHLVEGRRRHGEFWVPAPRVEFSYLLAKKALKGDLPERQAHELRGLAEELGQESAEQSAADLFGSRAGRLVMQSFGDLSLSAHLTSLRRRLWWRKLTRRPLSSLRYLVGEAARLFRRWRRPTGLLVVVLGPDGSGKSTLIEGLVVRLGGAFRRHQVFHWRPMVVWGRKAGGPVVDPQRRPPYPAWVNVPRLMLHLFDYWLGYWFVIRPLLARTGLVIFDRYFEDVLVDPRRYRYGELRWLPQMAARLVPRPDLIFVLVAPEDVLLNRKQEVAPEEVHRQLGAYRDLAARLPRTCILDASRPPAEVVTVAAEIARETLRQRLPSYLPAWLNV